MKNLPSVVWSIIFEYLSLRDLEILRNVIPPNVQLIADTQARKFIGQLLTNAKTSVVPSFAIHGSCYKFSQKHPRASQYWHNKDHGATFPCNAWTIGPEFPRHMKYSRNFHSNPNPQMTLTATNDRELDGWILDTQRLPLKDLEPREAIFVEIRLYPTTQSKECLQLCFNTLQKDMVHTFEDNLRSSTQIRRTISHSVPFDCARWFSSLCPRPNDLPNQWLTFLKSEVSIQSMFFAEKLNELGCPEYWLWKMLSFEVTCNMLTIPFNLKERLKIPNESIGGVEA